MGLKAGLPNAPVSAAAILTPKTAPSPMARALRAAVRLEITESDAAKFGILDRWQAAHEKQVARIARRERQEKVRHQARVDLKLSILVLFQKANEEEWSQRKLAAATGLPQTTLRRLRAGQCDPVAWLPRVRTAMERLLEQINTPNG